MNYIENNLSIHKSALRLLRIKDVMSRTGISRSYIYQLVSDGSFPKPAHLVPKGTSVGWLESEIEEWIDQRILERDQEASND
jgi:prophage regulatory protein